MTGELAQLERAVSAASPFCAAAQIATAGPSALGQPPWNVLLQRAAIFLAACGLSQGVHPRIGSRAATWSAGAGRGGRPLGSIQPERLHFRKPRRPACSWWVAALVAPARPRPTAARRHEELTNSPRSSVCMNLVESQMTGCARESSRSIPHWPSIVEPVEGEVVWIGAVVWNMGMAGWRVDAFGPLTFSWSAFVVFLLTAGVTLWPGFGGLPIAPHSSQLRTAPNGSSATWCGLGTGSAWRRADLDDPPTTPATGRAAARCHWFLRTASRCSSTASTI